MEIGRYNNLEIIKEVDFGVYLDGGHYGEILMPAKYVPQGSKPGDIVNVFVYLDNNERLIATTEHPYAQVGDFAYLEVAWTNQYGTFLSWGVLKDLFVPFREQKEKMQKGEKHIVYIYIDQETYRIVGSAKIAKFLSKEKPEYHFGEEVDILVWQKTPLGTKAIVNNKYQGLLYETETFKKLDIGYRCKAFIKQVRDDGKIDLILQKPGYEYSKDFSSTFLQYLKDHGGFCPINDESSPETINKEFGVSKKVFKKAVGHLYKLRKISIEDNGIKLVR